MITAVAGVPAVRRVTAVVSLATVVLVPAVHCVAVGGGAGGGAQRVLHAHAVVAGGDRQSLSVRRPVAVVVAGRRRVRLPRVAARAVRRI
ncbi:hypothetical protein [Geodermatophilus sp. FMUSA9-8]|uniref:hypothetical protein n=1 Tax=Geodermatophilus sp. FMUSA9-8 TaxID=3120155 RepID=UPI00300B076D